MDKKLRIGLLIDSFHQPAWVELMIEKINNSNYSDIVLIVNKVENSKKSSSFWIKIWNHRNELLYLLYSKIDQRIFKSNPNAFKTKDLNNSFKCNTIELSSNNNTTKIIQEIKSFGIDVFINLGLNFFEKELYNCSRYGIWSYSPENNIQSIGIWEVFEKIDTTEVKLVIERNEINASKLLYKSYSSTDKLSINRNKSTTYWKAASFLPRKLNDLYTQGEQLFFESIETDNSKLNLFQDKIPNNYETFIGIIKIIYRIFDSKIISRLSLNQWILLFKINSTNNLSKSFSEFTRMIPPKDRFWADPFVIERNNQYYIFLEELLYKENKGKISVITMDKNGNYDSPKVILEKNYHLSYPFLWEEKNELFMIPETYDNSTIELYKCKNFPYEWELHKTLMDNVKAVDTTILKKDDTYWMFSNIRENEGASNLDELFLFYSDNLISNNWTPHPKNPIISDVRSSRPAGHIFIDENKIYRPSQNCAKHYGYGMKINEIIVLNKEDYKEQIVESIYPHWSKDLVSTHTFNHYNQITVIDAIIKRKK